MFQMNPLLKKKGIPECILFVTQRLTKYPLLIEPLIKTSKENKIEQEKLSKALALVKVRIFLLLFYLVLDLLGLRCFNSSRLFYDLCFIKTLFIP